MFDDPVLRTALVVILTAGIVQLIKWERAGRFLETSKSACRICAILLVALGAVINGWQPDGELTLAEFWGLFWPAVAGVEFTYQWILKFATGLKPKEE